MPEMIQLARMTNNSMPAYTVSVLQDLLNQRGYPINGTRIALLGVAYKRNVDDAREPPFFELHKLLLSKGALLKVFDSWFRSENTVDSLERALEQVKAVVIVTEHSDILRVLQSMNFSEMGIEVIVDGRNCLNRDMMQTQNILYRGIGRRV